MLEELTDKRMNMERKLTLSWTGPLEGFTRKHLPIQARETCQAEKARRGDQQSQEGEAQKVEHAASK